MSSSKKFLNTIESNRLQLFHGSGEGDLFLLEPRQAYSWDKPDGTPSVCASVELQPALFMAIIGSRKGGGWTTLLGGDQLYYTTETVWDRAVAENWTGFIYTFPREGFRHYKGFEWRCEDPVKVEGVYKVDITDLGDTVRVIQESDWDEFREKIKGRK